MPPQSIAESVGINAEEGLLLDELGEITADKNKAVKNVISFAEIQKIYPLLAPQELKKPLQGAATNLNTEFSSPIDSSDLQKDLKKMSSSDMSSEEFQNYCIKCISFFESGIKLKEEEARRIASEIGDESLYKKYYELVKINNTQAKNLFAKFKEYFEERKLKEYLKEKVDYLDDDTYEKVEKLIELLTDIFSDKRKIDTTKKFLKS